MMQHTPARPVSDYVSPEAWRQEHPGVIGRTLLYEAIRRGEIPHVRVGRRILVPSDALDRMLAAQQESHPDRAA